MHDVLCKSLGSSNAINVARATIDGLQSLQRPDEVAKRRGLAAEEFVPKGMLNAYNERKKQRAAGVRTDATVEASATRRADDHRHPDPVRRSPPSRRPAARCAPSACGRIGDTNTLPDRPEIRGMIARVPHLVAGRRRSTTAKELTCASTNSPRHPGPPRPRKRVGRGIGGKGGKTAGRGTKGQQSRSRQGRPRLRRRPDAAQAARAEAEGLQQPVPRRVPARSTSTSSTRSAATDGRPRGARRHAAWSARATSSRCSPAARSPPRSTSRPRRLEGRRGGDHRGRRYASRWCRCRSSRAARPSRATSSPTADPVTTVAGAGGRCAPTRT